MNINTFSDFQKRHRQWLEEEIVLDHSKRDKVWTESLAVGNEAFVNQVHASFGGKAEHRRVKASTNKYVLREMPAQYSSTIGMGNNCFEWNIT